MKTADLVLLVTVAYALGLRRGRQERAREQLAIELHAFMAGFATGRAHEAQHGR